jgi:hypothetical protein
MMEDTFTDETDVVKFEERQPIEPKPEQQTFLSMVERLSMRPDIDVEKIKQIMDMQEHILDKNAEQAFNAAMTRAQSKIRLVVAKSKNTQTGSIYADLKTVLLSVSPIYTAEGFSLMFYEGETTKENHKRICVDIMHEKGHTKTRYIDLAIQTAGIAGKTMMTQIHGEGSAFSYGRRYLTCLIFNIPTGDDDDGNAAGTVNYINEKQLSSIIDMINSVDADQDKFCKYMQIGVLEEMQAKDIGKAMAALKAKKAKKEER